MATSVEELIPIKPKPSDGWDVERIRKDFPVLNQTVNGKPLIYLDNAASSQVPTMVIGRAIDGMNVADIVRRKTKITPITRPDAMSRVTCTSLTELRID